MCARYHEVSRQRPAVEWTDEEAVGILLIGIDPRHQIIDDKPAGIVPHKHANPLRRLARGCITPIHSGFAWNRSALSPSSRTSSANKLDQTQLNIACCAMSATS